MLPSIVIFLFILSFLVFIHELGHFLSARKFGVKVDEFGLGIPPRAWGKKVGETIYSLNWLPIGGFVKIRGEDLEDYDPKDPENFMNKKPWQRSVILLAGIFMNFVFAVIVFYFLLASNGWKSSPLVIWLTTISHLAKELMFEMSLWDLLQVQTQKKRALIMAIKSSN